MYDVRQGRLMYTQLEWADNEEGMLVKSELEEQDGGEQQPERFYADQL